MAITDFIMENLIWFLVGIAGIIAVLIIFTRQKGEVIENEVDVFFRGGTEDSFPCLVDRNTIKFNIGETEYNEPILHHPRVKFDKKTGKFYRSYKYAEGLGTIDVPPLIESDKVKIINYLIANNVIPKEKRKDKISDYTDNELMQYIKFYNFDIEQITDRPMANAFVMTVNMFTSMTTALISAVGNDLQNKGTSNIARVAYIIVGALVGFGFAWALTLKGVI